MEAAIVGSDYVDLTIFKYEECKSTMLSTRIGADIEVVWARSIPNNPTKSYPI
jgi:hypothetical protein